MNNPFATLSVSYFSAGILTFLLMLAVGLKCRSRNRIGVINWRSFVIGIALAGVDSGIFYAYQNGSSLISTPLLFSAAQAIMTILVGVFFFREHLSKKNLIGIVMCIIGVFLTLK